jgi:hypothetical protein
MRNIGEFMRTEIVFHEELLEFRSIRNKDIAVVVYNSNQMTISDGI